MSEFIREGGQKGKGEKGKEALRTYYKGVPPPYTMLGLSIHCKRIFVP